MIARFRGYCGASVLTVALSASQATGTVLVPADVDELSRDAATIVRGTVVAVDAQRTDDRRGVETLVTVEVERYLKGVLGRTVTFRVPGGRIGRFRSLVVGAPQFERDQQVIVFLGHRGPSIPYVLGLHQGVYKIARQGDLRVVTPLVLAGTTFVGPIVRGDPGRRPVPLEVFEDHVRGLVGERSR